MYKSFHYWCYNTIMVDRNLVNCKKCIKCPVFIYIISLSPDWSRRHYDCFFPWRIKLYISHLIIALLSRSFCLCQLHSVLSVRSVGVFCPSARSLSSLIKLLLHCTTNTNTNTRLNININSSNTFQLTGMEEKDPITHFLSTVTYLLQLLYIIMSFYLTFFPPPSDKDSLQPIKACFCFFFFNLLLHPDMT